MPKGIPSKGRKFHHSWTGGIRYLRNVDEVLTHPDVSIPDIKAWIERKTVKDPATGCWNWIRPIGRGGYAQINLNGTTVAAHRLSVVVYKGFPAGDLFACHICDNPSCVNPDHIYLGTHTDNMNDAKERKRFGKLRGKNHPRYKHGRYSKYAGD